MAMNSGTGQTQAVINMTPMIDILLVLLIIFMAISPMSPTGLNTAVARNSSSMPKPASDTPVVLDIANDGSYRLDNEAVSQPSLAGRLVAIFGRRGERVLFVKAAADLEFAVVARAIDTARGVNIDRMALLPR
jgi:biopolymer transport protein TolR